MPGAVHGSGIVTGLSANYIPPPPMNPLLHSLNIGTLATWLSVGSFGTVGVLIPAWHNGHLAPMKAETETRWVEPDITLGDPDSSEPSSSSPAGESPASIEESLPQPPELPELAEQSPLPEIPELPPPAPAKSSVASAESPPRKAVTASNAGAGAPRASSQAVRRAGGNRSGSSAQGGSGMSESARLAAGRMPPPVYPGEARRKGQSGTVMVEFVVDSSGRVISAYAKSPTPWPLLNDEAVRAVRRWKFPAGSMMKIQRPIVFQLR